MEESPEEAIKREEMLRMYHTCKESLRIIGDVSMATVTTPVPPPVKNDWLANAGGESARLSPPSPGGPRRGAPPAHQGIFLTIIFERAPHPRSLFERIVKLYFVRPPRYHRYPLLHRSCLITTPLYVFYYSACDCRFARFHGRRRTAGW